MDKSLRILNLEDTQDDSWLLQRHLNRAGYDCVLRREQTPASFEKALRESDWDVILADYFLPGFTALDALRIAQKCDRDVPFIVVSGAVGEQAAVDVLREGAADYVMKDSLARLVPAIEREMQEAEERRRRRAAEAALHESEMRLRGILDNSPSAVFMKDMSGRYVLANRSYEELLGLSDEEIRGKTDMDLYPREYAAVYEENEAKVREATVPMQFEELVPFGKEVRTRLANRFPLFDESGRPEGLCAICADITERKKSEETLRRTEKLAAAGRLAASIAHEINNPLEALVNLVFLVQKQPELHVTTRSLLSMVDQELNRVSHIARQTLAFYRESSSATNVDLAETVNNLGGLYGNKIRQRDIHLNIAAQGDCTVTASHGEMRQVLSNLLANAIDATPPHGRIEVRVQGGRDWSRGGVEGVRVTVADSGCGISKENLARIFDAFFTTKDDGTGTGLGLWVTQKILQKHNATIRVRSSVAAGRSGTVMRMFVPATPHVAQIAA
ncbi:MAG: ATP-binding protein [Acidobacteriaceae bacterium]